MQKKDRQVVDIFFSLLQRLHISVTKKTIKDKLLSHPDFPSLACFADVCKDLQMDYLPLGTSPNQLIENGSPCIAHVLEDGGHFVLIEDISPDEVIYYHPEKKRIRESVDDFVKKWSRIVFYAIPTENSGEEHYVMNRLKELLLKSRLPVLILLFVLLFLYSIVSFSFSLHPLFISLLIVKVTGLIACIHLQINDIGSSSKLTDKLCQSGKHTNCDDVLHSPAAKIFNLISMSDIGLIYFSGGLLCMLLSMYLHIQGVVLTILLLLSLFSIPYIFFSLSYQAFKLKRWCPFCVLVISTLIVECMLFIFHMDRLNYHLFQPAEVALTCTCFTVLISGWSMIKPLLLAAVENEYYKYNFLRLKKNPHIYNAKFNASPSANMEFSDQEIIVGNPQSTLTVTSVINTRCAPCAKAHETIKAILNTYSDKVRFVFRFTIANNNHEETLHLIELYHSKGESIFMKALDDWFKKKDYNSLKKKYDIEGLTSATSDILMYHIDWCNKNAIISTPTIYLNDKKIEKEYQTEDIEWLVYNILSDN